MKNETIDSISFVVPCYNEQENVSEVVKQIEKALDTSIVSYEIILINDHSDDQTGKIMFDLKKLNHNIKIITNNYNLGLGGSLSKGFKQCKCDYVMYLPGDNCHSYTEIRKMILQKNFDVLLSFYSNSHERNFFRKLFTSVYTPFLNLIFRLNLPYYNGIAIYKRKLLKDFVIKSSGFTWQIELLVKILKLQNIRLILLPTILKERNRGKSKAFKIKNSILVIYSIFIIFYNSLKK